MLACRVAAVGLCSGHHVGLPSASRAAAAVSSTFARASNASVTEATVLPQNFISDAKPAIASAPPPLSPSRPLLAGERPPPPPRAQSAGAMDPCGGVVSCLSLRATRRFVDLSRQLEELDVQLVPTDEQYSRKRWLEDNLKPLLERHTGGVLHMFGSCENGFWMKGSDVDVCLVVRRCTQRQSWVTKLRLVDSLVRRERIGFAEVVRGARVPVAKVFDNEGLDLCDVSVNNTAALENSRFVQTLSHLDPRTRILGRFIKHWASRRRINNRSEGTLSTYTLILQLIYFLQTREAPVLPLVTELLVEPMMPLEQTSGSSDVRAVNQLPQASEPEVSEATGELRSLLFLTDSDAIIGESGRFRGQNSEGVGELLAGFFRMWGAERFRGGDGGNGQTVSVFDGTVEENDLGVLVMRCPLTGKNVNPFTTTVWVAIHGEYQRAASLLEGGGMLEELCAAAEEPPAGHISRTRSVAPSSPTPPPPPLPKASVVDGPAPPPLASNAAA
eukprot:TRINITY_DN55430_c0_g1_i1.p1 TRINITY_DN55430_c0_g1~~TRINITY_DN55430_c0_g1_i1.p1  ORF type:complete len:501 (+),score=78.93 TRINITY_DN55430_c0_g1_i1:111-1613(+)